MLNALSEVGAGPRADAEEGDAKREEMLKDMMDDIQNIIWEYRNPKEKVGKKSASGSNVPKPKARMRKRKTTDVEQEGEASSSDDEKSCTEHSE